MNVLRATVFSSAHWSSKDALCAAAALPGSDRFRVRRACGSIFGCFGYRIELWNDEMSCRDVFDLLSRAHRARPRFEDEETHDEPAFSSGTHVSWMHPHDIGFEPNMGGIDLFEEGFIIP